MVLDELIDLDEKTLNVVDFLRWEKERVSMAYNNKIRVKTFST